MQSEVLDVIHNALIKYDIDRLKQAVLHGDEEGLNWVRDLLDNHYSGFTTTELIDEFQGRGLELMARERPNLSNHTLDL
jgi:hypothetical protein